MGRPDPGCQNALETGLITGSACIAGTLLLVVLIITAIYYWSKRKMKTVFRDPRPLMPTSSMRSAPPNYSMGSLCHSCTYHPQPPHCPCTAQYYPHSNLHFSHSVPGCRRVAESLPLPPGKAHAKTRSNYEDISLDVIPDTNHVGYGGSLTQGSLCGMDLTLGTSGNSSLLAFQPSPGEGATPPVTPLALALPMSDVYAEVDVSRKRKAHVEDGEDVTLMDNSVYEKIL